MIELDFEVNISQLKKIFSNSTPSKKLYAITDEQKPYVRKLNVLFGGFHEYLKNKNNLTKKASSAIIEDIEMFLQIFHLDYSEKRLSELDKEEVDYYLQGFLPRKWLGFSKSDLKSMCGSLKVFLDFLREKLDYFPNEIRYRKMMDALNANEIIDTIDWGDNEDEDDMENPNAFIKSIRLKFEEYDNGNLMYSLEGDDDIPRDILEANFMKWLKTIQNVRESDIISEIEFKKDHLKKSITLEKDLMPWYSIDEINVGKMILNNVYKNFHKLKTINERGLVAAIDYALNEILSKKASQKEIAKRHDTSPATLINNRHIIAPCIPLELFYPLFISESDLKSNKEKTYIFKVSNYHNRRDWSKFELKESNTLDDLHHGIQRFMDGDFYDEHLYSFFMNGKEWDDSEEYAGPPEYQQEHCSRLTNIQLKELKLGYKQRFLYLYDYGDCFKCNVTIIGLGVIDDNKMYPHRIK